MPANYFIGTSGWHYDHWRSRFYPQPLAKSKWLQFYAGHFTTVELNNSFYRLPSEAAWTNWRNSSTPGFSFAVKVSRFITHIKRLRNTEEAVATFLSGARRLAEKLGPLLYQLPPNMHRNDQVLEAFVAHLPPGYRHVIEFRHESWLDEAVFDILRQYHIGLCIFDMPDLSCPFLATADFAYIRFHGSTGLYASCYTDAELAEWGRRIMPLAAKLKAVYVYFNNDTEAFAINNARTLGSYLQSVETR